MKIILILAASLSILLSGCAVGSFPQFPEMVQKQYTVDIVNQAMPQTLQDAIINPEDIPQMVEINSNDLLRARDVPELLVRCLEFQIVSKAPYKIKYLSQVELIQCQGVTGFKPKDAISIYNWMDDVYEWAKDRKKCFK